MSLSMCYTLLTLNQALNRGCLAHLKNGGLDKVAWEDLRNVGNGHGARIRTMSNGHCVTVLEQHWVDSIPAKL